MLVCARQHPRLFGGHFAVGHGQGQNQRPADRDQVMNACQAERIKRKNLRPQRIKADRVLGDMDHACCGDQRRALRRERSEA